MAIKVFKTADELRSTHDKYREKIDEWIFLEKAYKGGKEFIKEVLFKNKREDYGNYRARIREAINFNYAGSIIDLFNFYLTEKKATRNCAELKTDKQWDMFLKDANLKGIDYNLFLDECHKLASISGAVGILVDKPSGDHKSVADEVTSRIYPYVCPYTLPNVLDWEYEVNPETGREELSFLKLKMGEDLFYIWTKTEWKKLAIERKSQIAEIGRGKNELGLIPFVIMSNLQSVMGALESKSDIRDVAYIVGSIIRNMSSGEEVIKYAGFPIYRRPMEPEDFGVSDGGDEDEDGKATKTISVSDVEEFDPEHGDAGKPDWMKTEISEPIDAILRWTDRKVDEIFRVCHLSGVHGQRKSNNEVSSGLALRYEFQQLTSVMNKKSDSMTEADFAIIRYWLMWQDKENLWDSLEITRPKNFSIDELAATLDNVVTAMSNVQSKTFRQEAQRKIVKQELPNIPQSQMDVISKEIESVEWVDPNKANEPDPKKDQQSKDGDKE